MPKRTLPVSRQPIEWKEPNRRGRGPTLTTEGAAKRLNLSVERVRKLALYGPELDGLPAYVAVGSGWKRRIGNQGYGTLMTMFYSEDIEAWDKAHPVIQARERVPYTEAQKSFVLAEAEKIRQPDGSVVRRKLRQQLASERPGEGWSTMSKYAIVAQILDDAQIPKGDKLPQATPHRRYRDDRVKKSKSVRSEK